VASLFKDGFSAQTVQIGYKQVSILERFGIEMDFDDYQAKSESI
jgi:hypothetical protein